MGGWVGGWVGRVPSKIPMFHAMAWFTERGEVVCRVNTTWGTFCLPNGIFYLLKTIF